VLEWLFSRVAHPLFQVGAGYAASILIRNELYLWLFAPAVIVVLLNVLVTLPWWTKPAAATVLLRVVRETLSLPRDHDVRCAIFRPTLFGKHLVEVVMVTQTGEQRRRARAWMKVSQGVAGRVYRTSAQCLVPITGDWRTHLMTEFGFTSQELSRFNDDRKSYLCVPILGDHGKVKAVLSFDSKEPDTFYPQHLTYIESMAPYFSLAIKGE
jgi:GAF domain